MESQGESHGEQLIRGWEQRLERAGLSDLANIVKEGFRPLAPLAAQLLWFAQPGFALFGQSEAVGDLASFLAGEEDSSPDHVPHG